MQPDPIELLSRVYPTREEAAAELAASRAELTLPRPTELFISDVHGEYQEFAHILRSGCGAIAKAVDETFGTELGSRERARLVTLVCYPQHKLASLRAGLAREGETAESAADSKLMADLLDQVARLVHTLAVRRSRLARRSLLPDDMRLAALVNDVMEHGSPGAEVLAGVVASGRGEALVRVLARTAQALAVGRLHLLGDIFDRGPAPDLICDEISTYHDVDVQWGNHDIVWMGAALGQPGCIAHVVRNCARYGNLSILADSYGLDLGPLEELARTAYADDPCVAFGLKGDPGLPPDQLRLNVQIQKAMAIIQFKVEAQLIDEYPEFGLADRKLLGAIDFEAGTVAIDGVTYPITDTVFPTVDPADPYALTDAERDVVEHLRRQFMYCARLRRHIRFIVEHGSLYRICDNNLLLHACVPLEEDGSLKQVTLFGHTYQGRSLFDAVDRMIRTAFDPSSGPEEAKRGRDLLWYLWLGQGSPLFAKSKMATFEIYYVDDKAAKKEVKNPFYRLLDDREAMAGVFRDFGMDPETSRIVCGHVPVKVKDGEDPVRCGGQMVDIDGGMSKPYQAKTGIAGFALVEDAEGSTLHAFDPFAGTAVAIAQDKGLTSRARTLADPPTPTRLGEVALGAPERERISQLLELLRRYDG